MNSKPFLVLPNAILDLLSSAFFRPSTKIDQTTRAQFAKGCLAQHKGFVIPAIALDLLIIASCWHDESRRWISVGIVALHGISNTVIYPNITRWISESQNMRLREYGNYTSQVFKVLVSHAAVPTWGWLLAFAAMTDKKGISHSSVAVTVLLGFQVVAGYWFGTHWIELVTYATLTALIISVSITRSSILLRMVSQQRHQREELEQIQKMASHQEKMSSLGLLAAGIAHEINNPMAFVTSNVSQLQKDLPDFHKSPSLMAEYADEIIPEIREGIVRVNTIVDDLRRFARGDVDTVTDFDVNEIIRSAIRITHGQVAPGVSVNLSLADIPQQKGFARQLSQVVVNLMVNAIEAVSGGGTITVQSGCNHSEYWLSIQDTGPGMNKDTQSRVFEPFFTTKPLGEATGLGLSVVHGIVEQLNGRIDLSSEPGKGARFLTTFPKANSNPSG